MKLYLPLDLQPISQTTTNMIGRKTRKRKRHGLRRKYHFLYSHLTLRQNTNRTG